MNLSDFGVRIEQRQAGLLLVEGETQADTPGETSQRHGLYRRRSRRKTTKPQQVFHVSGKRFSSSIPYSSLSV